VGQASELEAQLAEREAALVETNRVGWHLLHLVAIWTQLHTFDRGVPRSLVWAAWAFALVAPARLAPLVTPKRLGRFWTGLPVKDALRRDNHIDCEAEARLITELSQTAERHMARIRRGLAQSIVLGLFGLGLVALGYVVEKV